ncbi:MAG TPA: N-acetylmuramoyl-L-alanine amidase [Stellaceae bacterium]|nr:N-acetylmuramoyl-L-alanine amidase [Stellaceae bacterium]
MRNVIWARRRLLRSLAGAVFAGLPDAIASAQPAGRALAEPRGKVQRHHLPLVVIDPGHGGIDPGAIGPGGIYEKYITFATATDLARALRATGRFRVALDRGPDEYVPLHERVARAEALRANLFLSIHADALPNPAMRGLSVFTLSATASDREAAALAASENREVIPGLRSTRRPSAVDAVLIDLMRRQADNQSLKLARDIVETLGQEVKLLENPQRSAGFVVLTSPDIPSALVELGCLSNPVEERLLQLPSYRRRLARGLAQAIKAYFAK